jgi:molecular chaperone DnaK (HSP70)
MTELLRCANCLAPLRLDTGTVATCTYCGAQTRIDAPREIAAAPVTSGARLAETVAFALTPTRSIPLLEADSPLPIFRTNLLSTSRDNQESLEVHLVQGKDSIASFSFPIQQRASRGVPKISLTVRVATNGAMSITLSEPGTTNALDRDAMMVHILS